jgi:hypothetical protein
MAFGREGMLRDPGTFWHTRTGELILEQGFIRSDPYTFTFPGTWWVPYQWLGEIVMAEAHRVGGFDAQLLGSVTLLAAVFAWLTTRLLRTGLHPVIIGSVMALALAAAGSHFHVRPHLFTLTALAITVALLADFEAGRIPISRLFWLVPLFIIWTNVHGGLLGGLATLLMTLGGWVVFRIVGLPSPLDSGSKIGRAALLAIGCGLTMLVNPYGTDMIRTWRVIMDEPLLKKIIGEHRPLDVSQPYAWPLLAFAGFYLFVLAGVSRREIRVTWLLPVVWLALAGDRCRHCSLFVVVSLVALADLWPATLRGSWLERKRPDLYTPNPTNPTRPWWAHVLLPGIVVATSFFLITQHVQVPVVGAGWARHDPKQWPVELIDVMKENEPKPGEPNHIFNDYVGGAFVIYHTPGYKVFVDDRCEVFGGQWLFDFVKSSGEEATGAIRNWEREYGQFNFALTESGTKFDDYFRKSPEWLCVKRTETAAFYKRR